MKTSFRFAWSAGVVVVLSGLSLSVAGAAPDPAAFVGVKTCGMCHRKDESGNQLALWQNGPHAKAYSMLASPEAKAAGAKVGVDDPQKSGKCLKCHATAYNGTETPQIEKIAVEDGITCESCHGAGKEYKSKAVMQDRAQAVAAGLVYPATKSCETCHNSSAPTWKPDRYTTKDGKKVGFDVEQAFEKIKHPDPLVKK